MNSQWNLDTLGDFTLSRNGSVVAQFRLRKEHEVLARLAVEPRIAKSRDSIVAAMWPDAERRTALKYLSYNLYSLRRQMQELGLDDIVEAIGRRSLRIHPSVGVDNEHFRELAVQAVQRVDPVAADEALAAYGGELLPGFVGEWVQAERESLAALQRAVSRVKTAEAAVAGAGYPSFPASTPAHPGAIEVAPPSDRSPSSRELLEFAKEAEEGLASPEAMGWVARIEEQYPLLEERFGQAVEEGRQGVALDISGRIWAYWYLNGQVGEGRYWLSRLFSRRDEGELPLRARSFHALGVLTNLDGNSEKAIGLFEAALQLWQKTGDMERLLKTLNSYGTALQNAGQLQQADQVYAQAARVAEELGDDRVWAIVTFNQATIAQRQRDYPRAEDTLRRLLREPLRGDELNAQQAYATLAAVHIELEAFDAARSAAEKALQFTDGQTVNDATIRSELALGQVARYTDDFGQAEVHFRNALASARELKSLKRTGEALSFLAMVERDQGYQERAEELRREAMLLMEAGGDTGLLDRFAEEWAAKGH